MEFSILNLIFLSPGDTSNSKKRGAKKEQSNQKKERPNNVDEDYQQIFESQYLASLIRICAHCAEIRRFKFLGFIVRRFTICNIGECGHSLVYFNCACSEKGVCQRLVEQLKQTERGQISKSGNERNEVVWLDVGDRVYALCMRVSCSYRLLLW